MLGKLSWDAIPLHEPIPLITSAVVLFGVLVSLLGRGTGEPFGNIDRHS